MAWTVPTTRTTGELVTASIWNTDIVDNLNYIINSGGDIVLSSVGPHALGSASPDTNVQVAVLGTHTPGVDTGVVLDIRSTVNALATRDAYGLNIRPTIVEAGSGTHNLFASALIQAPTITAGAGATTFGATLFVKGASTGATYNIPLYVEGDGHDDIYVAISSTDVAHGVTDLAPTTFFGVMRKGSATEGGLSIQGYTEGNASMKISGVATSVVTTEAGASTGNITLIAEVKSGTTTTPHAADDNVVVFKNNVNATHIFKGDGSSYEDVGTAWGTYDDYDDVSLIEILESEISTAQGDPIKRQFTQWMVDHRDLLTRLRLATFNADGTIFANRSRIQSLLCGFARQCAQRIVTLETRVAALEEARA
jgi:hypothetical protein